MGDVTVTDRRRIDDVVACLGTFRDGDGPAIRTVLPEVRSLLKAELAGAYSFRQETSNLSVDFLFTTGMKVPELPADFEAKTREPALSPLSYDPFRPAPDERNTIRKFAPRNFQPRTLEFWTRHGLGGHNQLRMLLCEGPTLLAWVGGFFREPFGPAAERVLRALAPALRRRLLLERQLQVAPVALQIIGAVMDAVGAPAFLLRGRALVLCNAAGRAMLDRDRRATLEDLHDHLAGRRQGGFALSRHVSPGAPDHVLAVARVAPADPGPRAASFAVRWGLTPRQTEVLCMVARGCSNKVIAADLHCAEGTVEFHLTALLAKAHCGNRAELVAALWTHR